MHAVSARLATDDVLVAVPSLVAAALAARPSGFVPVRTRLDYMGIGLTLPLDARADAWTLSLGDTDFF